jgi:hypothetical protein
MGQSMAGTLPWLWLIRFVNPTQKFVPPVGHSEAARFDFAS